MAVTLALPALLVMEMMCLCLLALGPRACVLPKKLTFSGEMTREGTNKGS